MVYKQYSTMAEYACIADGDVVWAHAGPGMEELQSLVAPAAADVPPTISFMSIVSPLSLCPLCPL